MCNMYTWQRWSLFMRQTHPLTREDVTQEIWPQGFSCCELLLWEAGSWDWGQFSNPEIGEHPPLKATIRQQLLKTITDWEDLVCAIAVVLNLCHTVGR
jgi:hypothetical protein